MEGEPVEPMTRAIVVCAVAVAMCVSESNLAQELAPGEIVSVGQNIYMLRITGKLPGDADRQAKKRATEFCAGMKLRMISRGISFDMGYGLTLTWSCQPPKHAPSDH
jgi:hypothetical protein